MAYLRLRQICFVARDLETPARALCEVFGLAIAWRDPEIARLGLANVLIPAGREAVFLEIVSPIRPGTTAERYLNRRGGDGGYMVICDTSDLEALRARAAAARVRELHFHDLQDGIPAQSVQLHPKDTGGALLEFDRHGAGEDLDGPYRFAGPDWRAAIRPGPIMAVLGVEVQADDPKALAASWSRIFGLPVERAPGGEPQLRLDNAFARFTPAADGRGEGLSAVHLAVTDAAQVRATAKRAGVDFAGDAPVICGVRFHLSL